MPSAKLHAWDATGAPPPEAAFEGVDVVVNLVGESISSGRWTEARKKRLRDSRVVGTRALVDACGVCRSDRACSSRRRAWGTTAIAATRS